MKEGLLSEFLAAVPQEQTEQQPYTQILWHLGKLSKNLPCSWGRPGEMPSDLPKYIGGPSKHYTKAFGWEVKYYGNSGTMWAVSAIHKDGNGFWLRWDLTKPTR
mgnify:CR=1 FL=1|jgi:hypothetical protein